MNNLYILRHAKSSWAQPGLGDMQRPLNKRGTRQVARLEKWLIEHSIRPDRIVCSPSTRTQETYRGIKAAFEDVPLEIVPRLYNGRIEDYLEALWAQDAQKIMIIGHNPTCDELARYLTKPGSPAEEKLMAHHFGTATMAVFNLELENWQEIGQASGSLEMMLRPRDLESS
ncbi:MAG: phosphohistidine phosphatase SixA [Rhizobiaceae bacterium]